MHSPWHGLIHCPECNALHGVLACPICGHAVSPEPMCIKVNGVDHIIPSAMQGAIPWSTFVLLEQIKIESERSIASQPGRPARLSQRFTIVLLFWTLFEVLMDSFYRAAFADLPGDLGDELLRRFPNIGGRLDLLYRRTWRISFWEDLQAEGFFEEAKHLRLMQQARNAFVHGDPEAIDDALVEATLAHLEQVQRGWIVLFNKRCTGKRRRVPIWLSARGRTVQGS